MTIGKRALLAGLGGAVLARPALAQRDTSKWLIEMPATKNPRRDVFAIILSGDGGWRDIDRTMGRNFRDRGMSVVGFDCLNWFWTRRSPQEVATELDRAMGKNDIAPEIVGKARIGDIRHCFCDATLAAEKLDFRATQDFQEGLAELAEWVAQQTATDNVAAARAELEKRGLVA